MAEKAATQFNIHEAKTQLSRIVERVERGEEVVISRAGLPVAKVVPLPNRVRRTGAGALHRQIALAEDGIRPTPTRGSPTIDVIEGSGVAELPIRYRLTELAGRLPELHGISLIGS